MLTMYLKQGVLLHNRYEIQEVLGHGGFGITYAAQDTLLNVRVAIKEYLPRQLAARGEGQTNISIFTGEARQQYDYGLRKFLEEAQSVARFSHHPNIVSARDYFEANDTAYMVMEYVEGMTLKEYLENKSGKISFEEAKGIMMPVMDALREVHQAGLLHRDISPDNIYLTTSAQVKILDFGAARYFAGEQSRSLSVILKPGYAPEEQYRSSGKQGAWTDVYAVGATFYKTLTGQTPPDALDRLASETLLPPSRLGIAITLAAEQSLLKALAVQAGNRFQTMGEFQQALLGFQSASRQFPGAPDPVSPPGGVQEWSGGIAPSETSFISPGSPPVSAHPSRRPQRLPWAVAAAAGFGMAVFLGIILYFWQARHYAANAPGQVQTRRVMEIDSSKKSDVPKPSPAPIAVPQEQTPSSNSTAAPAPSATVTQETAALPGPALPAQAPLDRFQAGSKWLIDWQSLFHYHGVMVVQQQLAPNRYMTRITISYVAKNRPVQVAMDGLLNIAGTNVVINCSNASESWWDTDSFYLNWQNDTMAGYNVDQKGRRGNAIFKFAAGGMPEQASNPGWSNGPRWPWTSLRPITANDLNSLSIDELELMRNEIYARHGWIFNRADLQNYFNRQPWYRPRGDKLQREMLNRLVETELNPVEKINSQILRAREQALKR
jgi:serine/threonine protein kinase